MLAIITINPKPGSLQNVGTVGRVPLSRDVEHVLKPLTLYPKFPNLRLVAKGAYFIRSHGHQLAGSS